MVDDLASSLWLDKYTRAVFVELAVFNPNVNLFSVITLLVEFPQTNAVTHSVTVNTFRSEQAIHKKDNSNLRFREMIFYMHAKVNFQKLVSKLCFNNYCAIIMLPMYMSYFLGLFDYIFI